jgi:P4 family phage/plasmid primase-like protien
MRDCYWSIASFPPGASTNLGGNALDVRALVVDDVGTKVPEAAVRAALGAPTAIVETSSANFQYAYRLSTPVLVADWGAFFAGVEQRVGQKLEGKDAVHLFRLPMGVNTKKGRGRFAVRLVEITTSILQTGTIASTPQTGASGPGPSGGGTAGIDELRALMGLIPNTFDDRDTWIEIGHGLKALCENDADGLTVFDEWSATHPSYDAEHTRSKWDSFGAGGGLKSKGGMLRDRAEKSRAFMEQAFDDDPPLPPSPPSGGGGSGQETHVDMAEKIIRQERGTLGWMSNASSRWAGFDTVMGRWVMEDHDALMRAAVRDEVHSARMAAADPKDAKRMAEAKWRGAVQGLLVRERRLMLPFDGFDADLDTFGVPGGVIRLGLGGVVEESGAASQMVSKAMAVRPAPRGVRGVAWEAFLDDFTMGDPELRAWWQCFMGYCLTGHTNHHAVVFVHGPGGNGKSVFLDTVAAVMGAYHRRAPHTLFMEQVGTKHMASVADLVGSRLVTTPDVPSRCSWDLGLVKSLTGGGKFKAQFMRENWFEFTPQFKLVLPGNEKPDFGGAVDASIRRRFWLVPALHAPKTVNINLVDVLRQELPAVLRWMLDGWEMWAMFGGFPPCRAIERGTDEYLSEMDVFGKWKGTLVKTPGDMTRHRVGDLWNSWDAYRASEGSWKASPVTKMALATKLREAGYSVDRDKLGAYVDQISVTKSTDVF